MKSCKKCLEEKPETEFYAHKTNKDGLSKTCKSCERIASFLYKEARREAIREKDKAYRDANRDRIRFYGWARNYIKQGKPVPERYAPRLSKKTGLKVDNLYRLVYKYKARGAEGQITQEQWQSLCNHYGNKCLCCNKSGVKLTLDHVVPIALRGTSDVSNIQPLCHNCNSMKHDRYADFRPDKGLYAVQLSNKATVPSTINDWAVAIY